MKHHLVETVWGAVLLEWDDRGLLRSDLPGPHCPAGAPVELPDWLDPCAPWLRDFFLGKHPADIDFRPHRTCTEAEWEVYRHTRAIPPGRTKTYGEIAAQCGRPGAAQWTGQVLGRNPWPPFIPCHRVIGASGKLTGFSAPGGVDTKRRMLELECGREQATLDF